jgi:hypothetical protein
MSMGFSTSFTSEFLVSESARIVLRLRELVQILAPEERFTCLRVQNYRYWHPVNNSKYVFVYSSWHTGIFSSVPVGTEELSTKSYGCTSFMTRAFLVTTKYVRGGDEMDYGAAYYDRHSLRWSRTILVAIKVLFSIKALFRRRQSPLIVDTEAPDKSRVYSVSEVAPHY